MKGGNHRENVLWRDKEVEREGERDRSSGGGESEGR